MALSDGQRRTLARRAADNSLEVEHLLRVAAIGDAADVPFLRTLQAKSGWSDSDHEGDTRVVPFGRWADVVCRFLEDNYAGLVRLAGELPGLAEFCIAVLEELRTQESASALLAVGGPVVERPATDLGLAIRLASGFNLLLSFKDRPRVRPDVEREIRGFLHRLLAAELTEAQRATVVCALRGVGDADSMALIAGMPPFGGSWAGLERAASVQIARRSRRSSGPA